MMRRRMGMRMRMRGVRSRRRKTGGVRIVRRMGGRGWRGRMRVSNRMVRRRRRREIGRHAVR